jgi:ABC-2 type transport system permease protein
VSSANPLTYEVDALRALMLPESVSRYGLALDAGVLVVVAAGMVALAARMYPRLTA